MIKAIFKILATLVVIILSVFVNVLAFIFMDNGKVKEFTSETIAIIMFIWKIRRDDLNYVDWDLS